MAKRDFKDYICRPYCMFFKEGQKEEIACEGARIIELLTRRERIDPEKIPLFKKYPRLWEKHKERLGKNVCSGCSFQAEDCDFQSMAYSSNTEPCGGFILLAFLEENNFIDESDLQIVL